MEANNAGKSHSYWLILISAENKQNTPSMNILTNEQDDILKRTRDVLGLLRDTLGQSNATEEDRTALGDSIRQLDELFLLVIAGEFNSGKSSFINALTGQNLQEVGVTPTTSHVHLLKYGQEVSSKAVESGVWVHTAPVNLLRNINIVDTPGTNAIVREHEALTSEFIPRSDLVLFITSADRPFSNSERTFLNEIKNWGKKIVLVINKIDILADSPQDTQKVIEFVHESAVQLIGKGPTVFAVSARWALQSKTGEPRLWGKSGFEQLEDFVYNVLDDAGRFALKLNNPLGVGQKLINQQLTGIQVDLDSLADDTALLDDITRQMNVYDSDMQRNFEARLGEIDNVIYEMEKRGNQFFDDTLRLARVPDLIRQDRVQHEFERDVIGETPQQIEDRAGELIDWLVEQDLRQWTAVADHLQRKREQHSGRILGEGGPREGTLAYDRQRLVDSIGYKTREAVATYNKAAEAEKLAASAREAVVQAGLVSGAGIGLGAAVALMTTAATLDITGVLAGVFGVTIGLLILPSRKRAAKRDLAEKLSAMRSQLMAGLKQQFEREMQRSARRIEDAVAPFSRFVRAEQEKIELQQGKFVELDAHIVGLKSQLQAMSAQQETA
ncbi:MAG: dynamin family protein [Candidatus Promineifilaceae bacterium]